MQLSRSQVVQLIRDHGDASREDEARNELPETVDTERHGDQLAKFGLDERTIVSAAGSESGV